MAIWTPEMYQKLHSIMEKSEKTKRGLYNATEIGRQLVMDGKVVGNAIKRLEANPSLLTTPLMVQPKPNDKTWGAKLLEKFRHLIEVDGVSIRDAALRCGKTANMGIGVARRMGIKSTHKAMGGKNRLCGARKDQDPDFVDRLRALVMSGASRMATAEALGVHERTVKNAVERLGISFKAYRASHQNTVSVRKRKEDREKLPLLQKLELEPHANGVKVKGRFIEKFYNEPMVTDYQAPGGCQWPLWKHGQRPQHRYCGDLKLPGKSWCACHYAMAFRAPPGWDAAPAEAAE